MLSSVFNALQPLLATNVNVKLADGELFQNVLLSDVFTNGIHIHDSVANLDRFVFQGQLAYVSVASS